MADFTKFAVGPKIFFFTCKIWHFPVNAVFKAYLHANADAVHLNKGYVI